MTTLTDFKQAEQLDFDLDLAIAEAIEGLAIQDPGAGRKRKPRLTKRDAVSPALVTQWPGEHIEPRRW